MSVYFRNFGLCFLWERTRPRPYNVRGWPRIVEVLSLKSSGYQGMTTKFSKLSNKADEQYLCGISCKKLLFWRMVWLIINGEMFIRVYSNHFNPDKFILGGSYFDIRRYKIQIQTMTSLRNQAFRIFVKDKFYGIMTVTISQQYYRDMWKKLGENITKVIKWVNDSMQDKSNPIVTRKILQSQVSFSLFRYSWALCGQENFSRVFQVKR